MKIWSEWNSGPPPSIGWWPASNNLLGTEWRWWNGEYWSAAAFPDLDTSEEAATWAAKKQEGNQQDILWRNWEP